MEQHGLFETPPISVSALTHSAKIFLEQRFPLQWVRGEISNFTRATSGHWYFTLKDQFSQVRCTFFRARNQWLEWLPSEGMAVEVRALVTLYEARAEFQLNVQDIRLAGRGALYQAFEALKYRLQAEGLFAAERKRALPAFAKCIGIVTSPAAAALRDVITTLRRRMPLTAVILYPTPVQGEGAATRMAAAITLASERGECDVLIVCRGGGSIEDLWCCNEEVVARAIAASGIPIISGVGHETDFTIADFVADVRAATPTGAAELATPRISDIRAALVNSRDKLARLWRHFSEQQQQTLDHLERRLIDPRRHITQQRARFSAAYRALQRVSAHQLSIHRHNVSSLRQRLLRYAPEIARTRGDLAALESRLAHAGQQFFSAHAARMETLRDRLEDLNPRNVLRRGYAIITTEDGRAVQGVNEFRTGDRVRIKYNDGDAGATVDSVRPNNDVI